MLFLEDPFSVRVINKACSLERLAMPRDVLGIEVFAVVRRHDLTFRISQSPVHIFESLTISVHPSTRLTPQGPGFDAADAPKRQAIPGFFQSRFDGFAFRNGPSKVFAYFLQLACLLAPLCQMH